MTGEPSFDPLAFQEIGDGRQLSEKFLLWIGRHNFQRCPAG
jgi:hypothetical protein